MPGFAAQIEVDEVEGELVALHLPVDRERGLHRDVARPGPPPGRSSSPSGPPTRVSTVTVDLGLAARRDGEPVGAEAEQPGRRGGAAGAADLRGQVRALIGVGPALR